MGGVVTCAPLAGRGFVQQRCAKRDGFCKGLPSPLVLSAGGREGVTIALCAMVCCRRVPSPFALSRTRERGTRGIARSAMVFAKACPHPLPSPAGGRGGVIIALCAMVYHQKTGG